MPPTDPKSDGFGGGSGDLARLDGGRGTSADDVAGAKPFGAGGVQRSTMGSNSSKLSLLLMNGLAAPSRGGSGEPSTLGPLLLSTIGSHSANKLLTDDFNVGVGSLSLRPTKLGSDCPVGGLVEASGLEVVT